MINLVEENRTLYTTASRLEDSVGNTPLLPLVRITSHLPKGVQIYAKTEWFNPGGSVKDRPAINIIRSALASGELSTGQRLLDSTSGNMGIAYATFGASMGIPVTLVLPENASPERIKIIKALGAEIIFSDPVEGTDGAMRLAEEIARKDPGKYFYSDQYNNPANWQAHYQTTGPEIEAQTAGRITHLIAGLGTTGTLTGAGRYLRQNIPAIQLIGVQPDSGFHGLEGIKHLPSACVPGIYDPSQVNKTIEISTESAYQMVLRLAREEGLFVGVSSGAALCAALEAANRLKEGLLVAIFPDAGYKYLSEKQLWEGK
jgi:S-sulfo-L-cysteine synthase (O-acetyl-L-serine-dependent)